MQALIAEMKDMRMLQPIDTLRSALNEASMTRLLSGESTEVI